MTKLDFSEFHPLDHSAFAVRCARYPGGFWRHVKFWALYQYQFPWEVAWHRLNCARARHDLWEFYRSLPEVDKETGKIMSPPAGVHCKWCEYFYDNEPER